MILLDTHVALWLAHSPERLGLRTLQSLRRDVVAVSAVGPGLVEAPFAARHARGLERFPELHGTDPFDRALLAQAATEGARFVTADRRLLSLGRDWIVDAAA